MYLQGTTKRLAQLDKSLKQKPSWFVMLPRSPFRKVWSSVEHILLIYIAVYVPF